MESIPDQIIGEKIYFIRGHKVMLDSDLAALYAVQTKALNLAVRRNSLRFPDDFMFKLTAAENECLRFQIETSNTPTRGGRRYLPHAFTEQGVAMLSTVLRSDRAILVNIQIMRTFVKLRGILASNKELSQKLALLERRYDAQFKEVFDAIRALMSPKLPSSRRRIGF